MLLYVFTLAPGVMWGDSAKLSIWSYTLELQVALTSHPLRSLVGHLFNALPWGDIAYRQNLCSAVCGALTVGMLGALIYELTHSIPASIAGAAAFGISHTFWLVSVMAESYTLTLLLLTCAWWLVHRGAAARHPWWCYASALVFGLSLTSSYLTVVSLPSLLLILWSQAWFRDRTVWSQGRTLALCLLATLTGAGLYAALLLQQWHQESTHLAYLFGGAFRQFFSWPKILPEVARYPGYLAYQFPVVGLCLAGYGCWRQRAMDRPRWRPLACLFLVNLIFGAGYMRQRQFYQWLPSYLVAAVWIGVGAAALWARLRAQARMALAVSLVLLPPLAYAAAPRLADTLGLNPTQARVLRHRDNNRYFLWPGKRHEAGPTAFAREVLSSVPPRSIVVADFTPCMVLRYYQRVLGWRQDVTLKLVETDVPLTVEYVDAVHRQAPRREIFLVEASEPEYMSAPLRTRYRLAPAGSLLRLEARPP